MSDPATDNLAKAKAEGSTISNQTAKKIEEVRDTTKTMMDKSAAGFNETSKSAMSAFQELATAYQQIASKNSARLTESIQELTAVKNPADFVGVQQKLLKESLESAFADSKQIVEITMSAFTTAFEPMKKNMAALQQAVPQSAHLNR
jgi:phasin family protein